VGEATRRQMSMLSPMLELLRRVETEPRPTKQVVVCVKPLTVYLNGIEYINPPLFQRALRPRLSLSGLDVPTFRSNSSP
jgi:hypothetical protein